MKFILVNAIKSIKKNLKINVIIILSLFTAYLFFFLGCCYIEDVIKNTNSFKYKNIDESIRFLSDHASNDNLTTQNNIEHFFGQYDFIKNFTTLEYNYYDDQITDSSMLYGLIDENFDKFFNFEIIEGRYFTEDELRNGAKVCIIEKNLKFSKDAYIGDTIKIHNTEVKIVGIINFISNASITLIPYNTLGNVENRSTQYYEIGIQLADINRRSEIDWGDLEVTGKAELAKDYYNYMIKVFITTRSSIVFISVLLVLAYAQINMINILMSKLSEQQKSLGIRVALGASYKQIFMQFFYECLILVLTAITLIFMLEPIINNMVKMHINHYFGIYTLITMIIVAVISSFFISTLLLNKFKKMNIVDIVKKL